MSIYDLSSRKVWITNAICGGNSELQMSSVAESLNYKMSFVASSDLVSG